MSFDWEYLGAYYPGFFVVYILSHLLLDVGVCQNFVHPPAIYIKARFSTAVMAAAASVKPCIIIFSATCSLSTHCDLDYISHSSDFGIWHN